jgi:hypothetical protein
MDSTGPAETPPREAASFSWGFWLEAIVVLALITGLYGFVPYNFGYDSQAHTVFSLIYRSWTDPQTTDWHHGLMVPLISIGLVLHQWKDLKQLPLQSSRAGLAVLVASLAMYWIGFKIDIQIVGFLSLQQTIIGFWVRDQYGTKACPQCTTKCVGRHGQSQRTPTRTERH